MNKPRIFFLGTLAAIVGVAILSVVSYRPPQIVTLPNGATVRLLDVTTAGNHHIRTGPNWDRLLNWLPSIIRNKLPSGTNEYEISSLAPVGIWVDISANSLGKKYSPEFLLSGEDGIELLADTFHHSLDKVRFIGFSSIPKGAKDLTIGVTVYQNSETSTRFGEFRFATTSIASFEDYPEEPIPQTREHDGLAVTLTSLRLAPLRKTSTYTGHLREARAEATFDIKEKGVETKRWTPFRIVPSDQEALHLGTASVRQKSKTTSLGFSPYPSPSRPWKLEVTFAKSSGFEPEELVTFDDMKVPSSTEIVTLGEPKSVGDLAIRPLRIDWTITPKRRMASIVIIGYGPAAGETRVNLVRCWTPDGTEVPQVAWSSIGNESTFEVADIPAGADRISFTFAVHKTQTFEFIARPQLVESLDP